MSSEIDLTLPIQGRLSAPIYLRLKAHPFDQTILSVREYPPPQKTEPSDRPLVVLTFHPGYLTGSFQNRDYFERLAPRLYQRAEGRCRLRILTINHPGYDLPAAAVVDRFHLTPYSIDHQPQAMEAALSWLFAERLARENEIAWIGYGHSMGGLALSRFRPDRLIGRLASQGRSIRQTKILSAPAFFLHPQTRAVIGQLDLLHALKQTAGRLPLYTPLATGLYRAFAPLFFRLEAEKYSLQTLPELGDFRHLDPFILLEQGRALIRFEAAAAGGPELLAGSHIILARRDGMIDLPATEDLIDAAWQQGHAVTRYDLDSTHLLELDAAEMVARIIWPVIARAAGL